MERRPRAHARAGYVRPYRTVRARSNKPVDWSDMEDLVFALRALPEQPEEQTSKRDDRLVERMLEQRGSMDYFEFDTAALAMFLVGRVPDAVSLQQEAIKKGGGNSAEYLERLSRYKAQLSAAPR